MARRQVDYRLAVALATPDNPRSVRYIKIAAFVTLFAQLRWASSVYRKQRIGTAVTKQMATEVEG